MTDDDLSPVLAFVRDADGIYLELCICRAGQMTVISMDHVRALKLAYSLFGEALAKNHKLASMMVDTPAASEVVN